MTGRPRRITDVAAYIEERIIRVPIAGCWLWTNGVDGFGYGQVQVNRKHGTAHRLAWETYKGPIPKGMWVLHRCDVPSCCNPHHLFLGTYRDNIDDMVSKNRSLKGERHSQCVLTEDQARAVILSDEKLKTLADRYGVTIQAIWLIRHRKNWLHLSL